MSSSAATLAGNVGAAARAHKERVLVSHTRRVACVTSAFRSGPLSGWGARRERAYRELRAVLRGGGGGRAFIQGVEEERSESVEYRSLESVISCGVQSVCVGSGACVRSVKRSVHHILHREWPRENVYVTARIVTIQNSNRQRRASLLHRLHGLLVYTGDRRAGESLDTARVRDEIRIRVRPPRRAYPQTRIFGRSEGFVPEIESWRAGL